MCVTSKDNISDYLRRPVDGSKDFSGIYSRQTYRRILLKVCPILTRTNAPSWTMLYRCVSIPKSFQAYQRPENSNLHLPTRKGIISSSPSNKAPYLSVQAHACSLLGDIYYSHYSWSKLMRFRAVSTAETTPQPAHKFTSSPSKAPNINENLWYL